MTRPYRLVLALPVVAVASITAAAQTAPNASRLTVEGCITKDDRTERSTAATQFVLTDRQADTSPAASGATSTGATAGATSGATSSGATSSGAATTGVGASGQTMSKKAYTLRSDDASVNLDAHVGKMVRVTGTSTAPSTTSPLAGRSPEATPHPGAAGPVGSTGSAFDTSNLPTLVVASIATIPGSCR